MKNLVKNKLYKSSFANLNKDNKDNKKDPLSSDNVVIRRNKKNPIKQLKKSKSVETVLNYENLYRNIVQKEKIIQKVDAANNLINHIANLSIISMNTTDTPDSNDSILDQEFLINQISEVSSKKRSNLYRQKIYLSNSDIYYFPYTKSVNNKVIYFDGKTGKEIIDDTNNSNNNNSEEKYNHQKYIDNEILKHILKNLENNNYNLDQIKNYDSSEDSFLQIS